MPSQVLVEIEGPSLANLYRIFEEKNSDLLLKIFGSKTVSESTATTDKSADDSTEKVRLILDSWKVVDISSVLDFDTGEINVESQERFNLTTGNLDTKPCLGFLRFRINLSEQEAPSFSFHDQLLMSGMRQVEVEGEDQHQLVFILASREEEGAMKGIRYKMSGQMMSTEALEGLEVEIRTPCMEKIRYKVASTRNGSIINSLMEDVKSDGVGEVLVSMQKSINPKFKQRASSLSKKIISLEEASRAKSEEIEKAKRKLDEKFENSFELKKIRGIQSDFETALGWAMADVNMNIQEDVDDDELAILADDPLNSSLTTNVDNEMSDLPPSSQDSY